MLKTISCHIRWAIQRDLPEIVEIEKSNGNPWTEEHFLFHLRKRNIIPWVAESGDRITGFMIYELHKSKLVVLNFAVAPTFRRHGVGTRMIDNLKSKLSENRRTSIDIVCSESNLSFQLFLRQNNFKAIEVLKEYYEEDKEDGYLFWYCL